MKLNSKYFLAFVSLIFIISVGFDNAFADHATASVSTPQGTSVPGCETTNECFIPFEVIVDVGGVVTWSNDDSAAHTVTAGSSADGPSGIFDSSLFMAGTTFSHNFEAAGEFPYFCMVHPWMNGIVKVGDYPYSPLENNGPKIMVNMDDISIFYLDEPTQIIRATVNIQEHTPSDGIYFAKITHLSSNKVLKDFEIYPKYSGNDLWSVQIAYPIVESGIKVDDKTLFGEFEIHIQAENISETGQTTFMILESRPELEPTPKPQISKEPEPTPKPLAIPALFVDKSKNPQHYVDRYQNEPSYKKWFDDNYSEYDSIYEAVGLDESASIPNPDPEPKPKVESEQESKNQGKILSKTMQEEYDVHLHKARAFGTFGYFSESMKYYDKALYLSFSKEIEDEKNQVWNAHLIFGKKNIEEMSDVQKGTTYILRGEFEKGLVLCSASLQEDSEDFLAFICKLDALTKLERYNEILDLYKYYPHLANKNLNSINMMGFNPITGSTILPKFTAYYHLGKYDSIIEESELLYSLEEGNMGKIFLLTKAVALEKQGKEELASLLFQKLLQDDIPWSYSREGDLNLLKGISYFLFRDFKTTIDYLENKSYEDKLATYAKVIAYYELENKSPTKQIERILPRTETGGGCLIATATYDSELAPQVQQLRELRDNHLLKTQSGSAFMESFNDFYYSFSPVIADYERENPIFKEAVKLVITPMISSLSILNQVDMETDAEVVAYGISLILLNVGMYAGVPAIAIIAIKKRV